MKTILIIVGAIAVLLVGGSLWSRSFQANEPNIISQNGIHWHPLLEIYVKGEKVDIPADIGIGPQYARMPAFGAMGMTAIHTHDDMPVIHLEFPGIVKRDGIMLGRFFEIWGKDMNSFGENMRMTVNGVDNTEFENYVMRDGDKIELRYE